MSRHTLFTLSIGVGAALIGALAALLGAFSPVAAGLSGVYQGQGIFLGGDVTRLKWLEILVLFGASVGVAWTTVELARHSDRVLVILCVVLFALGLSPALALHNGLFEPISTIVSVALAAAGGYGFSTTELGMRKRTLATLMGGRAGPAVLARLLESRDPLDLEAKKRSATVLTCRLLDSDEMEEKLTPADRITVCNLFLRSARTFLLSKDACVEISGNDTVRAYFGIPDPGRSHGEAAAAAALELRQRLCNLKREVESRWFVSPSFGIGLESGELVAGIFRRGGRPIYAAVGKTSETSRRLALANQRYASRMIVGPELFGILRDRFEFRPLEMFYDPEKETLFEIYELLDAAEAFDEEARRARDFFWNGVIRMREKRFEEALDDFSQSRSIAGPDPTLEHFIGDVQNQLAGPERRRIDLLDEDAEAGHARLIQRL